VKLEEMCYVYAAISPILSHIEGADNRPCRFLEDGDFKDWYKADCSQEDRRKILAPFEVPDFLSNQTSAALNGYFGSKSSLKNKSLPNSAAISSVDTLESLGESNITAS
jgi:hypothetical protein